MTVSPARPGPRVAIVHEWLVTLGGAEWVLAELLKMYPDAQVFTLVDTMGADVKRTLGVNDTRTSFLQRIPGVGKRYRSLLPLFPAAVRSLDLSDFDLVISNSHAVAKGVRTTSRQLHLSYCLSPMRYAWDLREQYLREAGIDRGLTGMAARLLLEGMRRWDLSNASGVDEFSTLSHYIADRIRRAYGRSAAVVYPPVDVEFFTPDAAVPRGDHYFTLSRFVPYKRIDMIAAAFAHLPDRRLLIGGDGPDLAKVRAAAGSNVTLLGRLSSEELRNQLRSARAFLFAADEDFGIAPVEAQACGTPVIAYGRGGALETVSDGSARPATGLFFAEQTPEGLAAAIGRFESAAPIPPADCRANAERFSAAVFRREFGAFVNEAWQRHRGAPLPP